MSERTGASPQDQQVDLGTRVADLDRRISRLSAYIDRLSADEIGLADYTRLLALHGQLCSRLGRLMRDQQMITGTADPELAEAMDAALDRAGKILGVEV